MADLIDRQAAIEAFDNLEWFHQNANKDMVSGANPKHHQAWYKEQDVYKTLVQLPSADLDEVYAHAETEAEARFHAQQRWIPCSERLPEDGQDVLVTYKTTGKIHPCQYHDDGSRNPWYSYIDQCRAYMNVVLAWMPLPEPYTERKTDDTD